jgi:hypothetical protein
MDDETQRALDREWRKPPRLATQGVPWRVVIPVLLATLAGFVALAVLNR